MRQYDLSPLYRSTVGFDRLFSMLDQASGAESGGGYPPYNIERTGDLDYRISVAVAGFAEADRSTESRENTLTIRGAKEAPASDGKREVLHQGIAARAFERRFQMADHVKVVGASLENGLLHVDLVRDPQRVLEDVGAVREALGHLRAALEVEPPVVVHPVLVLDVLADPDAEQDVVRVVVRLLQEVRVVGRDDGQAELVA